MYLPLLVGALHLPVIGEFGVAGGVSKEVRDGPSHGVTTFDALTVSCFGSSRRVWHNSDGFQLERNLEVGVCQVSHQCVEKIKKIKMQFLK